MAISKDERQHMRFAGRLRRRMGAHALTSILLAALLLGMVNYLSFWHYNRADWSRSQFFRLSEGTVALLSELKEPVTVTVLYPSDRIGYSDIRYLLEEYRQVSPKIRVQMVDPHRHLFLAEELIRKHGLDQANVVIVSMNEVHRIVQERDMVEIDTRPILEGDPPVKVAFMGEAAISSAINEVTGADRPVVYFLQGHGEHGPGLFDAQTGYSRCLRALEQDHVEVRSLVIGRDQAVPADCDTLVIAGPKTRFSSQEITVLSDYLNRNGRMMVLLDAMTDVGLDDLLETWAVKVGDDIVVDPANTYSGRELYVTEYPPHPITRRLQGLTTIFYLPRSVEPVDLEPDAPADRPRARELAASSSKGWAETDWNTLPMRFDPERDRGGVMSVAVAVERGEGLDMEITTTRLVVIGDASFLTNQNLAGANMDFFRNAMNWLVARESRLDIPPKPYTESRLVMTRHEMIVVGVILILGLPLLVAFCGILVGWRRRR